MQERREPFRSRTGNPVDMSTKAHLTQLLDAGQVSNKFYYVLAGELQLLVGDEPKTADGLKRSNLRMVRGHGFGELALTDTNSARLADAVGAAETSCLLSLRRDQYEMALKATRAEIILTRLKKPAEERTPEDL